MNELDWADKIAQEITGPCIDDDFVTKIVKTAPLCVFCAYADDIAEALRKAKKDGEVYYSERLKAAGEIIKSLSWYADGHDLRSREMKSLKEVKIAAHLWLKIAIDEPKGNE